MMTLKLRNALVSAGSSFVAALLGVNVAGAPEASWAALVAAGVSFFAAYKGNGNGRKAGSA